MTKDYEKQFAEIDFELGKLSCYCGMPMDDKKSQYWKDGYAEQYAINENESAKLEALLVEAAEETIKEMKGEL